MYSALIMGLRRCVDSTFFAQCFLHDTQEGQEKVLCLSSFCFQACPFESGLAASHNMDNLRLLNLEVLCS